MTRSNPEEKEEVKLLVKEDKDEEDDIKYFIEDN
jgi:hypothetical protein